MALIIEDGSVVANANSYVTVDEARAYALARGVTLAAEGTEGDALIEVMAIKAMDYLSTLNYKGRVVDADQALPYPRECVYIDYDLLPSDEIPVKLKNAQMQLIVEVKNGVILLPTTSNQTAFVKKQKVGPIEKEFSEAYSMAIGAAPYMPLVSAMLAAFLNGGFRLRSVRG